MNVCRRAFLLLALLVLSSGCASLRESDIAAQTVGQRVAFVTVDEAPDIRFSGVTRSRLGSAALVGGTTLGVCVAPLTTMHCAGDPWCEFFVSLFAVVCTGVATGAGITAALVTPSAEDRERGIAYVHDNLGTQLQQALLPELEVAASERRVSTASADRADLLVETRILALGAQDATVRGPLSAFVRARVRVLRAASREEIAAFDTEWRGTRLSRDAWLASPQRLPEALREGYRALAADIIDRVFLLYPLPDRDAHAKRGVYARGLLPEAPRPRRTWTSWLPLPKARWRYIDTAQPQFAWEAFPRERDRARAPEAMSRVTDVRYDLVVSRVQDNAPAEVVLRREGLAEPRFLAPVPLAAGARYLWSVRARFTLDGRERVTEWSDTAPGGFPAQVAPTRSSYRFRVPAL